MNFFDQSNDFVIYKKPVNMHRSFDGLVTLAITELEVDLSAQSYVLFMNRSRNQFKILFISYGHISIFTMRTSGTIQIDFSDIDKIHSKDFEKLITTTRKRKPRFQAILET
tara:strand:- start:1013 stop:1345 length:333 start_codon:yes stop_codon:yes gene_type:complete